MRSRNLGVFLLLATLSNMVWGGASTWTLDQVTFNDGKTLSGFFTYNDKAFPRFSNIQLSYFDGNSTHELKALEFGVADALIVSKSGAGTPGADLRFDPLLPSAQGEETYTNQTFRVWVGVYNGDNLDTSAGPLEDQTAQGRGRVPVPVPSLPISALLALIGLMAYACRRSLLKTHCAA